MQSPVKDIHLEDIGLPEFELPKIDLSDIEVPKVDIGKAIVGAATAVGLAKPRRSRWPLVLGAGVVVAVAGWAAMNASAIRERLTWARTWITEQLAAMRAGYAKAEEPVALTAAPTAPLDQPAETSVSGSTGADYPDGLGAKTDRLATNGRATVASQR